MRKLKPTPIWIDQNFIGAYPNTETNSKSFYRIRYPLFLLLTQSVISDLEMSRKNYYNNFTKY